jgi:hypothetical protein
VFLNTENISAFVGFSWKIEIEMHGATMKINENNPPTLYELCLSVFSCTRRNATNIWVYIPQIKCKENP